MSSNRPNIPKLKPLLRRFVNGAVAPETKWTDPFYLTPAYRAWRVAIVTRAGFRCEDIDINTGQRCTKMWPEHKLIADHIRERVDGGADLDPANGMCRCFSHHQVKTMKARAERHGRPG
jgi:hypothetical protein